MTATWATVAGQFVALLAAVFAYYKAQSATHKTRDVHSEVVDVKRATGTNRRAHDEASEPVKPEPSANVTTGRRHTDPATDDA